MPGSVFCQSEGPCPRRQRFIGKKSGYICSGNLLPDLISWCQLIICPPESNMFSQWKNRGWAWRIELPDQTHAHTGKHRHKRRLRFRHTNKQKSTLSVKIQTLHPSADVIPSSQSHVAVVKISPHEIVCQVPTAWCFYCFSSPHLVWIFVLSVWLIRPTVFICLQLPPAEFRCLCCH